MQSIQATSNATHPCQAEPHHSLRKPLVLIDSCEKAELAAKIGEIISSRKNAVEAQRILHKVWRIGTRKFLVSRCTQSFSDELSESPKVIVYAVLATPCMETYMSAVEMVPSVSLIASNAISQSSNTQGL